MGSVRVVWRLDDKPHPNPSPEGEGLFIGHLRCNLHDIMTQTRFQTLPAKDGQGRRIAHRFTPGKAPTLVFLPGYMSDMAGSKAQAVFEWAASHGQACLLLDYSGCGESSGDFADGTLSRWCREVVAPHGI